MVINHLQVMGRSSKYPPTEKKRPQKVGPLGAELATWLSATDHAGTFGAGFGGQGGGVKEGARWALAARYI